MKKLFLSIAILFVTLSMAEEATYRKHRVNIKALSVTKFELTDVNFENPKIRDLKGKDFFVISVREPGSDGRVYAVDKEGTIWWYASISSGAGGGELVKKKGHLVPKGGHETSNNIFKVLLKRRFHMSGTHPSADGINNMDFEILFTPDGQALHLGDITQMSHGCIHVAKHDISALFKWAKVGMPVVVLRGSYSQFLDKEWRSFKEDMKAYDKAQKGEEASNNSKGFDKVLALQGISFHVRASNEGSINQLSIAPSGLELDNSVITQEIEGTVVDAQIADINADGSPEIYVYVSSAGSGSYGSLIAYSSNKNKSLSGIYLTPLKEDEKNSKGYMGHDDFAITKNTLLRHFPIYNEEDANCCPKGGIRQLEYALTAGEASWNLSLVKGTK